jgi:5-methylcytosine-specific restriction enzyme subunit McrC
MSSTIPIKNIYYMLSYAFGALQYDQYAPIASEAFDHIHDLFAAILVHGTTQLLKQGLYHAYEAHQDDLVTIRGKIDMAGTIRHQVQQRRMVTCVSDEFTADTLFNRILKSTIVLLVRHGEVQPKQKLVLTQLALHFHAVRTIDLSSVAWQTLRFHQHTQRYVLLMRICQYICQGMLMRTADGGTRLAQFIDDQQMAQLFERFVLAYYRQHHPALRAAAPHIDWVVDYGDTSQLPRMKTDIVLSFPAHTLIIDTKYYSKSMQQQYTRASLHSHNLYQMYSYVKNYAAGRNEPVSGLILYAKTDALTSPDTDVVMHGNRLRAQTLDLDQEFAGIRRELDAVVVGNA